MTDTDMLERFHERAAIIEHEGKLSRTDAELAAYAELRKLVGRTVDGRAVPLPVEIRRIVSGSVNMELNR